MPVPNSKKIVTATPKNIVPCEPTQVDLALNISPQTPDAWLEVVGTRVIFTSQSDLPPTIHPDPVGTDLSARLGRLNLLAPGTATVYAATFMYSGDQIAIDMALTPRAEGLMLLHNWVKQLALEMDLLPPTPDQTLALWDGLGSVPSMQAAIARFTSIPVPTTGDGTTTDPFRLSPKLDLAASQAATDLMRVSYSSELEPLRILLERHLGQPVAQTPLKKALERLATPTVLMTPSVRGQLVLLLPSVNQPESISFISGRSQPVNTVAAIQSLRSPCNH